MRPLLGHGLGGFWTEENPLLVNNLWEKHHWFPMHAHNGYLGVFLEIGIVGLVVLLLLIGATYIKISRLFATDYELARLKMAIFLAIILHNFSEASLCNQTHSLWFWFLFSAVALPSAIPHLHRRFSPATGSYTDSSPQRLSALASSKT
jgi:O-antigen ligase